MTSVGEARSRSAGRTVAAVILAIIAIVFLIAGIIYAAEPAGSLPSFLNAGSSLKVTANHHTVREIGSFVIAVIFIIAAGFAFKPGKAAPSGNS